MSMEDIDSISDSRSGFTPIPFQRHTDYTTRYRCMGNDDDYAIHTHGNGISILTLAPTHPLRRLKKQIASIEWHTMTGRDRHQQHLDRRKVAGKRKRGGVVLDPNSAICQVKCTDGSVYIIRSNVHGKLIEVNARLNTQPELLTKGWRDVELSSTSASMTDTPAQPSASQPSASATAASDSSKSSSSPSTSSSHPHANLPDESFLALVHLFPKARTMLISEERSIVDAPDKAEEERDIATELDVRSEEELKEWLAQHQEYQPPQSEPALSAPGGGGGTNAAAATLNVAPTPGPAPTPLPTNVSSTAPSTSPPTQAPTSTTSTQSNSQQQQQQQSIPWQKSLRYLTPAEYVRLRRHYFRLPSDSASAI